MTTLMTYWIELDTSSVLPVKPAMAKTYVMSMTDISVRVTLKHERKRQKLTIHHHIHAGKLRPDLREQTNVSSVNVARVEELPVRDIRVVAFKLAVRFNLLILACNKRGVPVTFTMDESQDGHCFFPAIFAREPARTFWKEHHADEQEEAWDSLQTPRDSECCGAFDERASIATAISIKYNLANINAQTHWFRE